MTNIPQSRSWVPTNLVVALLLVLLVVTMQVVTGAYRTERGLYSDESAHFMNGLLIRDYVYSGFSTGPLAFARDYYQHYPKIAPLMWPPLFHGLLGVWLLPGWPPQPAAIALLGLFTAWTAWRLYTMVSMFAPVAVALAAAGFFVITPAVVNLSGSVMVDIVVAAFALESTYWLSRYFTTLARRDAIVFGLMAACGCLAKGNGVSIVLIPPCLIVLTGRYDLLRRSGLYLAAAIVAVVAVPLLAVSTALDASIGDFDAVTPLLLLERVELYAGVFRTQIGLPALGLAAVGIGAALISRPWPTSTGCDTHARGLVALVAAGLLFHLFTPHTFPDPRYVVLTFAPLYGLAALGLAATCGPIRAATWRWTAISVIVAALAASQLVDKPILAAQAPMGYRDVVSYLDSHGLQGRRILVISDELGEGAVVSELAARSLTPKPMAIRGSKLLASDDWMGRNFALRFDSAATILAELEALHVDYVVVDSSAEVRGLPYWSLVDELVTNRPGAVQFIYGQPVDERRGPSRPLAVYQVMNRTAGSPKNPSVEPGIAGAFGILK